MLFSACSLRCTECFSCGLARAHLHGGGSIATQPPACLLQGQAKKCLKVKNRVKEGPFHRFCAYISFIFKIRYWYRSGQHLLIPIINKIKMYFEQSIYHKDVHTLLFFFLAFTSVLAVVCGVLNSLSALCLSVTQSCWCSIMQSFLPFFFFSCLDCSSSRHLINTRSKPSYLSLPTVKFKIMR